MVTYQSDLCRWQRNILLVLAATAMASCASSGSKINQLLQHPDYVHAGFSDVLVIAVADDYDTRAHFERQAAAAIRETGATATPYYTVIGRNPPITSSDINNAVRARGFDSILMTRIENQDDQVAVKGSAPDAQAVRRDANNVFDVFKYDYEELNEPPRVEINSTIVLATDLFAAEKQERVWAIETTSYNYTDAYALINSEVKTIVDRLKKDGMVGH
jgi:hypothetical protein